MNNTGINLNVPLEYLQLYLQIRTKKTLSVKLGKYRDAEIHLKRQKELEKRYSDLKILLDYKIEDLKIIVRDIKINKLLR